MLYLPISVCHCSVHKKCHDKMLAMCPGSAKDSRDTKVKYSFFEW